VAAPELIFVGRRSQGVTTCAGDCMGSSPLLGGGTKGASMRVEPHDSMGANLCGEAESPRVQSHMTTREPL
jgi:hypothetical protein